MKGQSAYRPEKASGCCRAKPFQDREIARSRFGAQSMLIRESGTDLLDSPNRATLIELTFFTDKRG